MAGVATLLLSTSFCLQAEPGLRSAPDTREALFRELENSEVVGGYQKAMERMAELKALVDPKDEISQRRYDRLACWYQNDKSLPAAQQSVVQASLWLAQAQKAKDVAAQADFHLCRGFFRELSNDYTGARADYESGLKLAEQSENKRLVADALSSRGELLSTQGDLAQALEDLQVAHQIYHLQGNRFWAAYTLSMIANTYRRMGDFERAKDLLIDLTNLYQSANDTERLMETRYLLGLTYDDLGEFTLAQPIYQELLTYHQQNDQPYGVANDYISIADNRLRAGDIGAASEALAAAKPLIDFDYDPISWALWHLFQATADVAKSDFNAALGHLEQAGPVVKEQDNYRYLALVQKLEAETLASLGRWTEAYEKLQAYQETHELLAGKLRDQASTRMRIEFDAARKESENHTLKAESSIRESRLKILEERRRWQALVISLAALLVILLILWSIRQWRRTHSLQFLAMTDELTQLPNRRSIFFSGRTELDAARSAGEAFSVLVFDVDYFKRINDTWGHEVGDRVLQKIAECTQSVLRKIDRLGRTGGEEFLVTLPGADMEQAMDVAQRLCRRLEDVDYRAVADDLQVTVSIGVAQLRAEDADLSALMQRADTALYAAKDAGRNRVEAAL